MNDRRDGKLCPKAACLGKPEKLELTLRPFIFEGKSGRFLLVSGFRKGSRNRSSAVSGRLAKALTHPELPPR